MTRRTVGLILFFIIKSFHPALAEESQDLLTLQKWYFRWGDVRTDSGLSIPSAAEIATWSQHDIGYNFPNPTNDSILWVATPLPENAWVEPALCVFELDHYFDVYTDQKHVYTFGPDQYNDARLGRILMWHTVLLGENPSGKMLLIRIKSDHRIGAAEIQIGSFREVIDRIAMSGMDQVVMGSLFLLIGIGAFAIVFFRKIHKHIVTSFAILSLHLGVITLFQTELAQAVSKVTILFTFIDAMLIFFLPVSICYFFEKTFDQGFFRSVYWLRIIHTVYGLITAILVWLVRFPFDNLFFGITVLTLFAISVSAIKRAIHGNFEAKIFVGGFVLFTAFLFRDVLMGLEFIAGWKLTNHWGMLALMIALAIILEKRFTEAQKMLQEKILELGISEQRLRFMVENLPRGAVYHHGTDIFMNKAAEEITAYSRTELTTIDEWFLKMHPSDHAEAHKRYLQSKQTGFPEPITFSITRKDGEMRRIEFVAYSDWPDEVWLLNDVTERERAEIALKESREELRKLAGHLQEARETERAHIAREIHDELGQYLTGLKMDLVMIKDVIHDNRSETEIRESLKTKLDSTAHLLDKTVMSVRKIASDLRPIVLDNLGLIAAIEWQVEDFQNRTGIPCEYHLPAGSIELDKDLSTAIFRIVQESLTNVIRHAQASRVSIAFGRSDNHYFLEIKDNGKGIQPNDLHKSKSFGVIGIRERASLFGGEASIVGEPGRGTTVSVTIPISSNQIKDVV
ncbi:PAS domain S-box protein [bacterium]|nr:PAS domain S-box protein [bacterium]